MRAARLPRVLLLAGSVVGVLLALLAAAWVVPANLDWTRYRDTVEKIASAQLGRTVRIEGAISLALLPAPVLTAHRVAVAASEEDQPGIALDVSALRLQVAFAPLLAGRIVPRALVLREPELRVPWPLPDPLRLRSADWLGPFAARIEQGRLLIGRAAFTGIDATLSGSDQGTMSVSGTTRAAGLAWHVTARLGRAADGSEPLEAAFDGQGRATGLGATFAGAIAADGGITGQIAGRGPDLSLLLPAPPGPFRGESRVSASAGRAIADDIAVEIGGSEVRGTVVLRVDPSERLDVALAASRLDVDRWLPVLRARAPPVAPWGVPTALDLSVDAAAFGGGSLRRVRAALDLDATGARVRQADALLPGNALVRATGRLGEKDGAPRFAGGATLHAPDLRATLRWLAGATGVGGVSALPSGVPRSGKLAASILVAPDQVALSDIAGTIDSSPVAGTLAWRGGERPRTDIDVQLGQLALDPWLSADAAGRPAIPGRLAGTLRLAVAHARFRGIGIGNLALDAVAEDGAVRLHALTGIVKGAQVGLSGAMGPGGRIADGRLTLSTGDVAPLAALLPASWRPTPALWAGPAALDVSAVGPPEALSTSVVLDLADGRLEATPVIDALLGSWRGSVTLRHPGAARLLSAAGLSTASDWVGEGSLSLAGQFSGSPGKWSADRFELTAGLLRASGQFGVDASGPVPQVSGQIVADDLPVSLPTASDTEPFPVRAFEGWQGTVHLRAGKLFAAAAPERTLLEQLDATVAVVNGHVRLDPFAATRGAATLRGSASLDVVEGSPKFAVDAAVAGIDIDGPVANWPVDIAAGRGDAVLRLSGEGHSPAALVATAAGTLHLRLRDGVLTGIDLPAARLAVVQGLAGDLAATRTDLLKADPIPPNATKTASPDAGAAPAGARAEVAATAALDGGNTPFEALDWRMSIANEVATLNDATLSSPAGSITLSGTIGLPGAHPPIESDLLAVLRPDLRPDVDDPPAIGVRLTGPVEALRRTPEIASMARWLADHPAR